MHKPHKNLHSEQLKNVQTKDNIVNEDPCHLSPNILKENFVRVVMTK